MAWVMISQWENKCIPLCPPRGPGSIAWSWWSISRDFPRLITLCQPVLSQRGITRLHLPSMVPHSLWTFRRKAKVQPYTYNGWEKKNYSAILTWITDIYGLAIVAVSGDTAGITTVWTGRVTQIADTHLNTTVRLTGRMVHCTYNYRISIILLY